MRVGLFPVMVGRRGGGPETYERELLQALVRVEPENDYHVFCLDEAAREACRLEHPAVRYHILRPRNRVISMSLTLPRLLRRIDPDVFHATFTPPPIVPPRTVFTMHDTSMFDHPEYYPLRIRLRLNPLIRRGVERASLVLCISDYVRQAVRRRFGLDEARLAVAWHGITADYRERATGTDAASDAVAEAFGIRGPYVLYVGKFERRKNVFRILEAYRHFIDRCDDAVQLVMAGKPDWNAEAVARRIDELGLGGRVLTPGYVDEKTLPALYGGARMFVFPSLWEGFGLPLLEAMSAGTPVVTSQTTALAEVAGDAALLVDPLDSRAIGEAMLRCHGDPELRRRLIERGHERLTAFSWERCARSTLDAYRRCLDGNGRPATG